MIKLEAIGHLGKDATVNEVGGKKVINFSICHTEKYKAADGTQMSKSVWVECAKWGDNAAVAPYLLKGGLVYVQGTPEVRTYTTADGQTKATLALRVMDLQLLGGTKPADGQTGTTTAATTATSAQQAAKADQQKANMNSGQKPIETVNDDLPF